MASETAGLESSTAGIFHRWATLVGAMGPTMAVVRLRVESAMQIQSYLLLTLLMLLILLTAAIILWRLARGGEGSRGR